ncbi:uncharacterized protein O3C94_015329 [Discoglossus pictus]
MRLLLAFGVALGLIAMASTLKCKICKFKALSICFTSSSVESCTGNCSNTKASIGSVSLFNKQACTTNCVASNSTKDSIFDFDYSVSCCNTDECNGANSVKISLSLGLGLSLLWLINAL